MKTVLKIATWFAAIAVLIVALSMDVVRTLVFGWMDFLERVGPRLTVDGPSVAVGVVAFVLLVGLTHLVGRSWARQASGRTWSWRTSLCGVLAVCVVFAAGIAITGIGHQMVWLCTTDRPFREERVAIGATTENQLKSVSLGVFNYQSASRKLPASTLSPDGRMLHSWETKILVYLGHEWIYDARPGQVDWQQPYYAGTNRPLFQYVIRDFIRPNSFAADLRDADGFGLSHLAANSHVIGIGTPTKLTDLKNGAEQTILLGEVNAGYVAWGHPINWRDPAAGINRGPTTFGGGPNSGGAYVAMADGSVRFLRENIAPDVLKSLSGSP